ncbi:MAG: hypothetical protein M3126_03780 [Candidatus Eremiobacteraeota bacterium]|nr:hypothetical protein [Candidatus Eremiobacteraeota bacterium]
MKRIRNAFLLCIGLSFALASCGGGGSSPGVPGASTLSTAAATFTITIPRNAQGGGRNPKYISQNTASVSIALASGSLSLPQNSACTLASGTVTCSTTTTSAGCLVAGASFTCSLSVLAPVGTDTFILNMMDAQGNKLSSGQVTAAVSPGGTNVPLTMNGVVAKVSLALGTPVTTGSTTKIPVIVTATDASGATIIGPGSFTQPVTLTNSDTSGHTTLAPTSVPDPATGQTGVTLTYDGSPSVTSVTIGAPGTTATPVVFTPSSPSPSPSPTSSGGLASCSAPVVTTPGSFTWFLASGDFASNGAGAFTLDTSQMAFSQYIRFTYVLATPTPTPTATPTSTPTPTPTPTPAGPPSPTPTPLPVYIYLGTYNLAFSGGVNPTTGCAVFVTTQDGRPISGTNPHNAFGSGFVQTSGLIISGSSSGAYTMNLTVSASGTGSGTLNLSDGETGTISITTRFATVFDDVRKTQYWRRRP